MTRSFADHFTPVAPAYAAFRPRYPDALFDWLAQIAPARRLAWDCATGSGQAASGLARHFDRVVATDASPEQIAAAVAHPKISYRVAPAEAGGLEPSSADLITVAQALHWLDLPRFYAEAERVLVEGGVLAAWSYGKPECGTDEIDGLIGGLYTSTLGPYWPPERKFVETGYRTLPFPFPELSPPLLSMELSWTSAEFLGYLRTWSSVIRFMKERRSDPVEPIAQPLASLWSARRIVRWPLAIRVGRKERQRTP